MIIDDVKIDFGIIDQTILKDKVTPSTSDDSKYSDIKNTLQSFATRDKVAYLEKEYFLLDGTFILPEAGVKYNVGWESSRPADMDGNIDSYVEYLFEKEHVSYGFQIYFGEYTAAKDFEILFYKDDQLIGQSIARNNTLSRYYNYDSNLGWNRVRIHFTRVNAGQRARFYELTFGVNDTFNSDVLLSVSATRTTDLTGDYDDCGDFTFTFFNDHLEITDIKGLSQGLMEWLRVIIWIKKRGYDDFIKFGEYYSESTDVQERGKVITINGFDVLYRLGESTYRKGVVYPNGRSLGDWAEEIADDAGIELAIDDELYNDMTTGYITEVPHREALRLIAEAGNAILLVDPDGTLALRKLKIADKGELTDDVIMRDTLQITNPEKNLGVNVSKYSFLAAKDDVELGHIDGVGLTTEHQELEITYSVYPVITDTVQVFVDTAETSAKVGNIRVYSDRIVFDIWSDVEGEETFVTITGKPYNQATAQIVRGSDVKNVKKIENNFLITDDLGEKVADWQFERAVRKYDYDMEIATEDEYELEDKVHVQENNMIITRVGFNLAYGEHTTTIGGVDE